MNSANISIEKYSGSRTRAEIQDFYQAHLQELGFYIEDEPFSCIILNNFPCIIAIIIRFKW